jgi:hypothetical protein
MIIFRCEFVMSDDLYQRICNLLAETVTFVCVHDTRSFPEYLHFNEWNRWIVPDMLARLGIMRPTAHGHEFCVDWEPGLAVPVVRHQGAPSLHELVVGLEFQSVWYGPRFGERYDKAEWSSLFSRNNFLLQEMGKTEFLGSQTLADIYEEARLKCLQSLGGDESKMFPAMES